MIDLSMMDSSSLPKREGKCLLTACRDKNRNDLTHTLGWYMTTFPERVPTARKWAEGEKEQQSPCSTGDDSSSTPVSTSQTRTSPSSQTVDRCAPSRENERLRIHVPFSPLAKIMDGGGSRWKSSLSKSSRTGSQIMTLVSQDAVARRLPSGEKSQSTTVCWCPISWWSVKLLSISQTFTALLTPTLTSLLPSGDQQQAWTAFPSVERVLIKFPSSFKSQTFVEPSNEVEARRFRSLPTNLRSVTTSVWSRS